MKTLDLHGVQHRDIDRKTENYILLTDMPFTIITGKSHKMQELVINVLDRNSFIYEVKEGRILILK